MPDLGEVLWESEPDTAGFSMTDVRRRADRLRRRRRRTQAVLSVLVMVVGAGAVLAIQPGDDEALLGPAPVRTPAAALPSLGGADAACEQVDATTRRGTVDVPGGVGMQEAIEGGLVGGWTLAGPVWQLPVQDPADAMTWWTAAPVQGPDTAAVAVWVSPDRDATWGASATSGAPTGEVWERPGEVYLYAANDVALRASVWTDADDTTYALRGRSVGADDRVATCAASTQRWPTESGTPPSPARTEAPPSATADGGCAEPDRTHLIQPGDTLASIAEAVYGDATMFDVIAEANGLTGDNPLTAGRQLTIPGCPLEGSPPAMPLPTADEDPTPGRAAQSPLDDDERAILDAFVRFARSTGRPAAELRWADSISLHLADRPPSVTFVPEEVTGPIWTIEQDSFRAYTGPFNPLDLIAGSPFPLTYGAGPHPHCASPPVPAPTGLEDLRRLWIQPDGTSSCIEWFTVDLFINDEGTITAVSMDLYEP